MPASIYLDYNATTPLDPGIASKMADCAMRHWGNPSSIHKIGRQARALLDEARYKLSKMWDVRPSEVVFTGGGTESNNLAILGTARKLRDSGRHLITTRIEHPAALQAFRFLEKYEGFEISYLPVDASGHVSPDDLANLLRSDTILVSVMTANNEVGTVQQVSEIGSICRKRNIIFHTDAVQAFGKLPFHRMEQFNADLVTVCAHKFHGPKGSGALYIRSPLQPLSTQLGGSQENERRAGTENLPAIIALVDAFEAFVPNPVFQRETLSSWSRQLSECLASIPGTHLHGSPANGLCNTVSFSVENTDSLALLANLDLAGICASSGSACSVGSLEPSHVLRAMGVPPSLSAALVRFSLGRENTAEEIDYTCQALPDIIRRSQSFRTPCV